MVYPVSDAIKGITEGFFKSFAWSFKQKEEAEKFRRRVSMSALRAGLVDSHAITVVSIVKYDGKTIAHIVLIDEREAEEVHQEETINEDQTEGE